MNILVTGGTGFVGRNVADGLRKEFGDGTTNQVFSPSHSELDMLNLPDILNYMIVNQIHAVIHCAFSGHFGSENDYNTFLNNIKMYENLIYATPETVPIIIFGSGAEFDRRYNIFEAEEDSIVSCWPIDFYGMAKSMISKRALSMEEHNNIYVLRLFGCFGADEPDFRFIKRSILRLMDDEPIQIGQDKLMDFFYVEDIIPVVNRILMEDPDIPTNLNLVYPQPALKLSGIAQIICKEMGKDSGNIEVCDILYHESNYTGSRMRIKELNFNFLGLERGIRRMVQQLTDESNILHQHSEKRA